MAIVTNKQLTAAVEETFLGYGMLIENNPDSYRGGFEWSIYTDDCVWDSGLAFDINDAIVDAQDAIIALHKNGS